MLQYGPCTGSWTRSTHLPGTPMAQSFPTVPNKACPRIRESFQDFASCNKMISSLSSSCILRINLFRFFFQLFWRVFHERTPKEQCCLSNSVFGHHYRGLTRRFLVASSQPILVAVGKSQIGCALSSTINKCNSRNSPAFETVTSFVFQSKFNTSPVC